MRFFRSLSVVSKKTIFSRGSNTLSFFDACKKTLSVEQDILNGHVPESISNNIGLEEIGKKKRLGKPIDPKLLVKMLDDAEETYKNFSVYG